MTLRIAQLDTTCHMPPGHRSGAELVDALARGRFAHDLGDHLGPSLSRQPDIVRIRRLSLRVNIPAADLTEDALSLAWRQAFAKALFTALAYPSGVGPYEVFRAESPASFIASVILDLMDGTASTKWQYAEFEEILRQGSAQAAIALICNWPRLSMAILLELARRSVLDRLLARFDELSMETLFVVLAPPTDHKAEPLSVADLILTAKLVLAHLPEKAIALRSRSYALSLFFEAHRTNQPVRSPRVLFHALLALAVLLNGEVFWPGSWRGDSDPTRVPPNVAVLLESVTRSRESDGDSDLRLVSPNVAALLENIRKQYRESDVESSALGTWRRSGMQSPLIELQMHLATLRTELNVPTPTVAPAEAHWISTNYCGLFFLTGLLARLDWITTWRQLAAFQPGGVNPIIAGLALAIVDKFDPALVALDPGLALFAGYSENPDLPHARKVFQEFQREVRLDVLHAAIENDANDDAAQDWQSTFDLLAEKLLREFATTVRGFRQATRQVIVKSFIARPGRIRVERDRLVVIPQASPYHVALHLSGLDTPIASVGWLGCRLEFELGDL
jgi:hypothetical protein